MLSTHVLLNGNPVTWTAYLYCYKGVAVCCLKRVEGIDSIVHSMKIRLHNATKQPNLALALQGPKETKNKTNSISAQSMFQTQLASSGISFVCVDVLCGCGCRLNVNFPTVIPAIVTSLRSVVHGNFPPFTPRSFALIDHVVQRVRAIVGVNRPAVFLMEIGISD